MINSLNKDVKYRGLILALIILSGLVSGCAHPNKELTFLYPGQYALDGYGTDGEAVVFEDNSIKISAAQIKDESALESPITRELLNSGFILIKMEIKNKSRRKALYDPALTSLRDSKMGYFKPLDFTDLYMLKIKKNGISSPLSGVEKILYDLAERVEPGEVSSKILVFHALTEKAEEAELIMKSIYIGKDILDLTFNFVLQPRGKEEITPPPNRGTRRTCTRAPCD